MQKYKKRIHKIANIAFIYTLIGAFLCQNLAYASDISGLRPALISSRLLDETELKKQFANGIDILTGYYDILSDKGLGLLKELQRSQANFDAKKTKPLVRHIPTLETMDEHLDLFVDIELPDQILCQHGAILPLQLNEGCYNRCLICQTSAKEKYEYMPYPILLKLLEALDKKQPKKWRFTWVLPYDANDPFHYRDNVVGADFCDAYLQITKRFSVFSLTTNGWSKSDRVAQQAAEKILPLLENNEPVRLSYHFFYPALVEALKNNDKSAIDRLYIELKDKFKNVLLTLRGKAMVVPRNLDSHIAGQPGFPQAIIECQKLQDRALGEIKQELSTAGIDMLISSNQDPSVQWDYGRARKTLQELGFDKRTSPGLHTIQGPPGNLLAHVFRPDGRAEVVTNFSFKIGTCLDSAINRDFLLLLLYMKRQLEDTGLDKNSFGKEPYSEGDNKDIQDLKKFSQCINASEGFKRFVTMLMPGRYPGLYNAILDIDPGNLKTKDVEKIYQLIKDIEVPYVRLSIMEGYELDYKTAIKDGEEHIRLSAKEGLYDMEYREHFVTSLNPLETPDGEFTEIDTVFDDLTTRFYRRTRPEAGAEGFVKAEGIEQALLSGAYVDETEVREVFYNLAPGVFSADGLAAFKKINAFYENLRIDRSAREKILADSNRVAVGYIAGITFVNGMFPAGQFYCDMYDPVSRRFLSFMQLARGEIDESTYLRRDLPDLDFIHIFSLPEDSEWTLRKDADEGLRILFKEMAQGSLEWKSLEKDLFADFRISSIKFTSSLSERKDTLKEFMERDSIALCLGNPVPLSLWNNLHLFVREGDFHFLNSIRDLLIGMDAPLYAEDSIDTEVPREFQINFLLNQIRNKGPQDIESMLKIVFDEVAETMPGRPRHNASLGLVDFSRRHWAETFNRAQNMNLIQRNKDDLFEITKKGTERLQGILVQRDAILKKAREAGIINRRQFLKKVVNKKTPLVLAGGFLGYNLGLFTAQKLWAQEKAQDSFVLQKHVEDLNRQELDEVEGVLAILSISEITLSRLSVVEELYKKGKLYIAKADDVQKIAELAGDKIGRDADAATLALSEDGLNVDLYLVVIQKDVFYDPSGLTAVVAHELCGNLYNFYKNGPPASRENAEIFAYNSSIRILEDIIAKMKENLDSVTSKEDLEQTKLLIAILERSLEIETRRRETWKKKKELPSLVAKAATLIAMTQGDKEPENPLGVYQNARKERNFKDAIRIAIRYLRVEDLSSAWSRPHQGIDNEERFEEIVDPPLVEACKILYRKGIKTNQSSANSVDVWKGYAFIEIDPGSLSEENRIVAEDLMQEGKMVKELKEITSGKGWFLILPISNREVTCQELHEQACLIAELFKHQDGQKLALNQSHKKFNKTALSESNSPILEQAELGIVKKMLETIHNWHPGLSETDTEKSLRGYFYHNINSFLTPAASELGRCKNGDVSFSEIESGVGKKITDCRKFLDDFEDKGRLKGLIEETDTMLKSLEQDFAKLNVKVIDSALKELETSRDMQKNL